MSVTGGNIRPNEWMGPAKLRTVRLQHRMSQKEVADAIGISYAMWSQIESGGRTPGLITAVKIHEFFGVPNEVLGVK